LDGGDFDLTNQEMEAKEIERKRQEADAKEREAKAKRDIEEK
jgi:hypothetical protein